KEKFYDEMFKAIWGYIGDKLSIPFSDLTKDNMVDTMKIKNVEEELINKYIEILNFCEFARFAPSGELTEMKNLYSKTIDLISEMEEKIK
ncbi:MAG: protein BatD, partial [Bacteroidales bacterium]|nr:protein BatD [Bacteroidales bacterium]